MADRVKGECAFCSILDGGIPGHIIFREKLTACILDAKPVFYGHSLIIPVKHFPVFSEVPDEVLADMEAHAKLISKATESALGCDGTLMILNNKVSQSVPHIHMHVIPRKFGDHLYGFLWPRKKYSSEAAAEKIAMDIAEAYSDIKSEDV